MSLDSIKHKLLQSIKKEIHTEENKLFFEEELLKPLIHKILDQVYPYFMWSGLFFMSMFVFIMIILFLNIRVFLYA